MPPKKQLRKRAAAAKPAEPKGKKAKREEDNEEILSGSEDNESYSGGEDNEEEESSQGSEVDETADEKRARLAKEYLARIESDLAGSGGEDENEDEDVTGRIKSRLDSEVAEARGKRFVEVASDLNDVDASGIRSYKGHRLPATCIAVTDDEISAFTGSKDGSIVHWDIETGKRVTWQAGKMGKDTKKEKAAGHIGEVLGVAVSSNGKYVASGGRDGVVRVWDVRTNRQIEAFPGHRGPVNGLAFRMNSQQLFSGSDDRTIKVWNLDEMTYVETLFGHQSEVTAIDSLFRERCISCGGDRTVRQWKVVEESQLIYRGHMNSIDCVRMINEDNYLTGSSDGSVCVFNANKKKPTCTVKAAHTGEQSGDTNGLVDGDDVREEKPMWISSVAALRSSDLVASGSSNGVVRLWKWDPEAKHNSLSPLQDIPVPGFVNGMAFGRSGRFLACATGQEHRLGRWWRVPQARNGLVVVPLSGITMDL